MKSMRCGFMSGGEANRAPPRESRQSARARQMCAEIAYRRARDVRGDFNAARNRPVAEARERLEPRNHEMQTTRARRHEETRTYYRNQKERSLHKTRRDRFAGDRGVERLGAFMRLTSGNRSGYSSESTARSTSRSGQYR